MRFGVKGRSQVFEILLAAALAGSGALPAFATETHQFDVPSEDAPSAIRDFASQAHVQILAAGENVKDKRLHAVTGEFSTDQGLRLLLADSGLSPQYVGDRSIAIVTANSNSSPQAAGDPKGEKKSIWDPLHLAQVDRGKGSSDSSVGSQTLQQKSGESRLDEIVVSAQKKGDERLQDVPVPVTVLNANQTADQGEVLLRDYYASVPGLNVSPNILGQQMVSVRGITTGGFSNPTVAILVDDVAFGASTNSLSSNLVPDIDPGDLARVEVLRGPQGTLYGASSMGGLIKFVTKDPSPTEYSGRLETGFDEVHNGAEPGFNLRGSA